MEWKSERKLRSQPNLQLALNAQRQNTRLFQLKNVTKLSMMREQLNPKPLHKQTAPPEPQLSH
eukprot:953064-Rhodomonas_salina.1